MGELKKRTFAGETRESVHSKTAETRPSARTDSNERMQWETSLVDTVHWTVLKDTTNTNVFIPGQFPHLTCAGALLVSGSQTVTVILSVINPLPTLNNDSCKFKRTSAVAILAV